MKSIQSLLTVGLAWLAMMSNVSAVEPVRADEFAELHALIKPGKDEDKWAAIPWMTDLWQARQLAAKQGKPILLWEMDGHPLGCT
jgi:hypothetical protein